MPAFQLVPGLSIATETISLIFFATVQIFITNSGFSGDILYLAVLFGFGVEPTTAIPLSMVMIFSQSLPTLIFNLMKTDPEDQQKPAIVWDLVFIIENSVVLGVFFGSFITVVIPDWAIVTIEYLFIGISSTQMLLSFYQKYKQDITQEQIQKQEQLRDQQLIENRLENQAIERYLVNDTFTSRFQHFRKISKTRLLCFLICFALAQVFIVIRVYLRKCSVEYWVLLGCAFLTSLTGVFLNAFLVQNSLRNRHFDNLLIGSRDYILISKMSNYMKFAGVGLAAGIVAATFGTDGTTFIIIIFRLMKLDASKAHLASSVMLAFTSFTGWLQYWSLGQQEFNQIWVYMLVIAVFSSIGYFVQGKLLKLVKSFNLVLLVVGGVCCFFAVFIVNSLITTFRVATREMVWDLNRNFC